MTPTNFSKNRLSSKKAFSLTELLAVMVVVSLLAGLTAPLLNTFSSRNLTAAGNSVADLMNQARQNSMTKNVMTAMVVVKSGQAADWNGRLVALLECSGEPQQWRPLTRWIQLPEGVVVDWKHTGSGTGFFSNEPNVTPSIALPAYSGTPISMGDCGYQVFAPGGRLVTTGISSPGSPLLRLVEGSVNNGEIQRRNAENFYDIVVNRFTGISKIDRR